MRVVTSDGAVRTTAVRIVDKCPDDHCGIDLGGAPAAVIMGAAPVGTRAIRGNAGMGRLRQRGGGFRRSAVDLSRPEVPCTGHCCTFATAPARFPACG